jgi:hypothetical protein
MYAFERNCRQVPGAERRRTNRSGDELIHQPAERARRPRAATSAQGAPTPAKPEIAASEALAQLQGASTRADERWRTIQDETANTYVIEIAL